MRETARQSFAQTHLPRGWSLEPLTGDASRRRYFRASDGTGASRILMDADPATGEDVAPFLRVQSFLASLDLSVPEIEATDPDLGFILMEDLGDSLFSEVLRSAPDMEDVLYSRAAEILAHFAQVPCPDVLPLYDAGQMASLGALAATWYARRQNMVVPLQDLLAGLLLTTSVQPRFVHRDFHAENLIWLPDRHGQRAIGLLDFQDASAGHPAYDLASLIEDARRDVSATVQSTTRRHYLRLTGFAEEEFSAALSLQSAQRNLRILGVFARLCLRDGKPRYLEFIPRVWGNLMRDLRHPSLRNLGAFVTEALPHPTDTYLAELRAACGTVPDHS